MNREKIATLLATIRSSTAELEAELQGVNLLDAWIEANTERVPAIPQIDSLGTRYVITIQDKPITLTGRDASAYLRSIGIKNEQQHLTAARIKAQLADPAPPEEMERSDSLLETFLKEQTHLVVGEKVTFREFYDKFIEWLPAEERPSWTRQKVSRSLPANHQSGRSGKGGQKHIANLSWEVKQPEPNAKLLIVREGKLLRSSA